MCVCFPSSRVFPSGKREKIGLIPSDSSPEDYNCQFVKTIKFPTLNLYVTFPPRSPFVTTVFHYISTVLCIPQNATKIRSGTEWRFSIFSSFLYKYIYIFPANIFLTIPQSARMRSDLQSHFPNISPIFTFSATILPYISTFPYIWRNATKIRSTTRVTIFIWIFFFLKYIFNDVAECAHALWHTITLPPIFSISNLSPSTFPCIWTFPYTSPIAMKIRSRTRVTVVVFVFFFLKYIFLTTPQGARMRRDRSTAINW